MDLTGYVGEEVTLKFVNITGYGNQLYIDNINFKESPTGLNETASGLFSATVFPNPGNGLFTLEVNSALNTNAAVRITDVKGALIEESAIQLSNGSNKFSINIASYGKGVYILDLNTETGSRKIRLVVL